MKAAIRSFASCCLLSCAGLTAWSAPPEDASPALDSAQPRRAEVEILRPWEVNASGAPRLLNKTAGQTKAMTRPTTLHTAEFAGGNSREPESSDSEFWPVNALRQTSAAPASGIVSPSSPARPATREGRRTLFGSEQEYHDRDRFSYVVEGSSATGVPARRAVERAPAGEHAPRPLETSPTPPAGVEEQIPGRPAPRPLTTSAKSRVTAPGRWFRPNPLRDTAVAGGASNANGYVRQTAAQVPAEPVVFQQAELPQPASNAQPLPFDADSAAREAGGAATLKIKAPADEQTPGEAIPPGEEDGLSLDDLSFDEEQKTPPTSQSSQPNQPSQTIPSPAPKQPLPDSPFPALPNTGASPSNSGVTEKPASAKPADDFPFDLPVADDAPAARRPVKPAPTVNPSAEKVPSQEEPTTQPREDDLPFDLAPGEQVPAGSTSDDNEPPAESPLLDMQTTEDIETEGAEIEESRWGVRPLLAITTSIAPPAGQLPADRAAELGGESVIAYSAGQASRGWAISTYHWEATAMKHQPLYFEEVNLERYGYSRGLAQPAVSYGQFLFNVVAMPYKVMAEPPREEFYTLGQYRPGSYAPYRIHYPPRSAAGGMFEAGVILGLVFLIP